MPKYSFTKENLDSYLKELAKEFRKMNGTKMPAEIILIGGASILINYGFREMTYDMDAIIQASFCMKDAINLVGERMDLPRGWLNTDFTQTSSYSPKLIQYSKYYKTFSNVLKIRTVSDVYLIVMKLMAGRKYKNDLSDIIGILIEQKNSDKEITLNNIKKASLDLYDGYEKLPESSRNFIESVYRHSDLLTLYERTKNYEKQNKEVLLEFQNRYPNTLNEDNLENILIVAKKKRHKK